MSFEDNLFPPVIQRNQYGESGGVSSDDFHWDNALYVREDIVDEIVKFHLLLQWFCNGDENYWHDELKILRADLEHDFEQELRDTERNAQSDGYDQGYMEGYKEGHSQGYEEGYKQGYDEALKERSDGT